MDESEFAMKILRALGLMFKSITVTDSYGNIFFLMDNFSQKEYMITVKEVGR